MKRTLLSVLILLPFLASAQSIIPTWVDAIGGSTGDEVIQSTVVDASGNVYIGGSFEGTVNFNPNGTAFNLTSAGSFDAFFAKYTSAGVLVWANKIGSTGGDEIYAVQVDASGNVYVAGYFTGTADFDPSAAVGNLTSSGLVDIFYGKYSSAGALTWANAHGSTDNDAAIAIKVDGSGNVYVTGYFFGTVDFDPNNVTTNNKVSVGSTDIFLMKLTSAGALGWIDTFGSTAGDVGYSVDVDAANVYVSGYYSGTTDFDPGAANSATGNLGGSDGFFGKYTIASGALVWWATIRSTGDDEATSIAVSGTNFYLGGVFSDGASFFSNGGNVTKSSNGLTDIFIAKYDGTTSLPAHTWINSIGTTTDERLNLLALDASANVYCTGNFQGTVDFDWDTGTANLTSAGGQDSFIASYDASVGSYLFANAIGGTSDDDGTTVAVDASNNVYLGGYFQNTASFDFASSAQNKTSKGFWDGYIAKYAYSSLAPEPVAQPTNLVVVALNDTDFTYDITAAPGITGGYLHIYKVGTAPTFVPVDGVEYFQDDVLSDGSIVKYSDNVPAGNFYGSLTAGTTYYVKIFAYNGSGSTINYKTTSPLSATITTTSGGGSIPSIASFTPASGAAGTSVTITGANFSATAASNVVYFGAMKASVTAATTTQLTVTVPVGASYQPISVTANGLTAYSPKPFILTFSSTGTIDASSFAAKVDVTVGASNFNNQLSAGDFDGDSKPDLAIANQLGTTVSLIRNTSVTGSPAFSTFVGFGTGSTPQGVSVVDLDGDGKLDIVSVNNGSNTISAFKNSSSSGTITTSSFATKLDFTTGASPVFCAAGDLDLDGKPDLAVTNSSGNSVSIFQNQSTSGTITFAAKVDLTTDTSPRAVAIGDIDGDGKPDVAVANYGSATFSVFRNTSTGGTLTFATGVNFAAGTGTSPIGLALGDFDADGKTDLVVTNDAGTSVSVFRNTSVSGSLSFSNGPVLTSGTRPYSVSVGDLDGDGKPDLAVASNSVNAVSLFKNSSTSGSISFGAKVDFTTGTNPTSVVINDLDGDGKVDLAVSNSLSPTVSVFRNTNLSATAPTITNFNPTSGAVGTSVTITGTNFSTTPANNTVKFNGTTATATASTATSITTSVPSGATTGAITVTVGSQTATSSTSFTVSAVTLATEPTNQPTGLVFSSITSISYAFAFTAAAAGTTAPDGYIGIRKTGSAPTGVPVDGVTYAYPDVIGDGTVNFVGTGTSWTQAGASPSTSYYYAIYSYKGSGSSINYKQVNPLTGSVTTLSGTDTTEPYVANNTTVTSVAKGSPVTVTVELSDPESGVANATIYYVSLEDAKDDYSNFISGTMTKATGDTYTFQIPGTAVKEMGVEYYIRTTNGVGLDNYSSDYTVSIQLTADGLTIPFTSFGSDQSKYRIVSIPVQATDATADGVFGDDLGAYDKKTWRLFRYQGSTSELNGRTTLVVGNGYWLITNKNAKLDTGPGTTPVAAIFDPVKLTLAPGWNQIGNPYPYDMKWQAILDWNSSPTGIAKLRTFNGSWNDGTELEKFSGGFVMNAGSSSITLEIPTLKDPSINGRQGNSNKTEIRNPIDNTDWSINMTLEQGELSNSLGGFGMNHAAADGYDSFDDFNLPRFLNFIELNHVNKELHHFSYSKDVVPFEDNHTWEFSVESNSTEQVTMRWDNSYFGSNDKQLVLWDVVLQRGFDMRTLSQYTFNRFRSGQFKVFFGDEKYIKEKTIVSEVVFHDVFPNPARNMVKVSFSTPTEDRLTIEVIDLLGRKIATIADENFEPGYHEVMWNTQDASGGEITNGVYITQIKSLNKDQQKRLIINK